MARKARKPARVKEESPPTSQLDIFEPDVSTKAGPGLHLTSLSILNSTTDHNARCYFLSSYIVSCPFKDYLPSMYARCRPGEQDVLSSAISAAAFATFARRTGHRGYMDKARGSYSLALSQTNAALAHPATAVLDQTLASVLLLGVFETTVFPGARSPEEWTAHLLGACNLLQLRGMEQFRSHSGTLLFSHVASNIRASCVQRYVNMPAGFPALYERARPFLNPKHLANKTGPMLEKTVRIKARLSNLTNDKDILYGLFDEAVALDQEAAALLNNGDPELAYTIRPKEDTPAWAYRGIAYDNKSHRASKVLNTARMVRLFMLELMSAGASVAMAKLQNRTDTKYAGQETRDCCYFAAVKENARRLSDEISTEVLGCLPEVFESSPEGSRPSPCSRTLVWPLSVIYKNRICPPGAREYARSMMEDLVKDLNRLQYVDVRKLITDPESTDDW